MAPRVDPITAAIRGQKDEALRDLLSRTVKAHDVLEEDAKSAGMFTEEGQRLLHKAEGVRLVRSYIEEAIRANQQA